LCVTSVLLIRDDSSNADPAGDNADQASAGGHKLAGLQRGSEAAGKLLRVVIRDGVSLSVLGRDPDGHVGFSRVRRYPSEVSVLVVVRGVVEDRPHPGILRTGGASALSALVILSNDSHAVLPKSDTVDTVDGSLGQAPKLPSVD
jgi:hypothetical protein